MRLVIDNRFPRRETFNIQTARTGAHHITEEPEKPRAVRAISSPGAVDHPSPSKRAKLSPGSSSLSEMAQSPDATVAANDKPSPKKAASAADISDDERQPPPAPPVTQHAFFPDPLGPDPVIYHIREVTPGMTDDEKKEIYSVTGFPTRDLSDQIAGTPPDKDFSNAKPTNQVAANTFLSYVEPYVRPLTEEDIAFLRERVGKAMTSICITINNTLRAIARLPLSFRLAESVTTLRFGPLKITPAILPQVTEPRPTKPRAPSKISMMIQSAPTRSPADL
jgi:hypothetical protein